MPFLKAQDTISGTEGRAYATIGEETHEMFYVKKLEAKVEKEKAELKMLGKRGTQHKAKGWKGSGTLTIYYVTSKFRKMMYDYMTTGKDAYFNVMVINEDPTSSIGKQAILLKNVNLDSVIMASLDTGSDALEEEVAFTFDDLEIKNEFNAPTTLGY